MTHPNARQIQVRSSTRAVRGKGAGVAAALVQVALASRS